MCKVAIKSRPEVDAKPVTSQAHTSQRVFSTSDHISVHFFQLEIITTMALLPDLMQKGEAAAREILATTDAVDVLRGGFLLTACAVRSSLPGESIVVLRLLTVTNADFSS